MFLKFLFISWLSYGHRKGPKVLPWDWDENIFFVSQMSIKCQNFSPKIQLWKNWPFVRESNGVLFSNTHQTVVRWPWHDMISFFYSFLVVEKSCKVFLFKSWHGKKIAWGSSKQMIHTVWILSLNRNVIYRPFHVQFLSNRFLHIPRGNQHQPQ